MIPKNASIEDTNPFGKTKTPPGQVATVKFPVLTEGETPDISTAEWRFRVWGFVMQHAYGGYTTNNSLEVMMDEEVIFANTFNNRPLPREHGGPMRVFTPRRYACLTFEDYFLTILPIEHRGAF